MCRRVGCVKLREAGTPLNFRNRGIGLIDSSMRRIAIWRDPRRLAGGKDRADRSVRPTHTLSDLLLGHGGHLGVEGFCALFDFFQGHVPGVSAQAPVMTIRVGE